MTTSTCAEVALAGPVLLITVWVVGSLYGYRVDLNMTLLFCRKSRRTNLHDSGSPTPLFENG